MRVWEEAFYWCESVGLLVWRYWSESVGGATGVRVWEGALLV